MTRDRRAFEAAYGVGLNAHIAMPTEGSLRAAYELGRDAVVTELSVLELAAVHHETLLDALLRAGDADELRRIMRAAGNFFTEALSAVEMVQRGLHEARDAVIAERRRSTMIRQLSSLLSDPSLALGSGSRHEALRLVAEEARELTGASWCVATATLGGGRALTEVAGPDAAADARALVRPEDVVRRHALVAEAGGVVRLEASELADHAAFATPCDEDEMPTASGWMGVALTSLEGREFGCLEVFGSDRGSFSELDEALLVHVAQLASAALERAQLHRRPR